MAPSLLDILHLESRFPVFDRICSHLSIDSIIALTRTCRELSTLYQSLVPLQWNVDRYLSRFVRDPQSFRSQMGRHNALVSGSVALQFFERVVWKESDIDIFIEQGENAEAFGNYLIEQEGYKFIKATENDEYMRPAIVEARTYTRRSDIDSAELKAQIVLTKHVPLQSILTSFYSTVVLNFFSWNKAYAIFPLSTFVYHKGYLLKAIDNYLSTVLEKYSRRGWRFQEAMWPEDMSSKQPIQATRRIGDEFTWIIPFDTSNVKWSKTPDIALEYSIFGVKREGHSERPESRNYKITSANFSSEVLQHPFLYDDSQKSGGSWMMFLGERVDELTLLELYKMAPEARPRAFQDQVEHRYALYGCMRHTQKPESWTYWDDQIPRWYEAWRQTKAEPKEEC